MDRRPVGALLMVLALAVGCGRLFAEQVPPASAPEGVPRVTFEIVARDNRCEPATLAADREGRALMIIFKVNSVGKQHWFIIPVAGVRKSIPAGTEVTIPVVAERSGIFEYGCTGSRWLGPFDSRGKLAIR